VRRARSRHIKAPSARKALAGGRAYKVFMWWRGSSGSVHGRRIAERTEANSAGRPGYTQGAAIIQRAGGPSKQGPNRAALGHKPDPICRTAPEKFPGPAHRGCAQQQALRACRRRRPHFSATWPRCKRRCKKKEPGTETAAAFYFGLYQATKWLHIGAMDAVFQGAGPNAEQAGKCSTRLRAENNGQTLNELLRAFFLAMTRQAVKQASGLLAGANLVAKTVRRGRRESCTTSISSADPREVAERLDRGNSNATAWQALRRHEASRWRTGDE